MITSDRMAAIDRNAAALGVSRKQLMESSGNAVASRVRSETDPGDRIAIFAGRGNNGGDAFVAARFLEDRAVTVYLVGREQAINSEIAAENWEALRNTTIDCRSLQDSTAVAESAVTATATEATLIVDALLGTGVTGALREPIASATAQINAAPTPVLAVDVPTGLDPDTGEQTPGAVDADHVVTFHARKPGLEALEVPVTVADIGIPTAAELFVGPGDLGTRTRASTARKGDHGEILVVGGGPYTGAPALAAKAAMYTGADLVRVLAPESVATTIQGYTPDIIVTEMEGQRFTAANVTKALAAAESADGVVFGPGLGRHEETLAAARNFLAEVAGPVVVDADPLAVVPDVETTATLVCTPHRGELERMGGPTVTRWADSREAIEKFAGDLGATLLVKGPADVITDGATTRVNRTGTPMMTVGGTGDVLAGVTGRFFVDKEAVPAAALGAYLTGRSGEAVAEERGAGLTASKLTEKLPAVLAD